MTDRDELLDAYLFNRWGYGSWDADYWFVGPEEGGAHSSLDVILDKWDDQGRPDLPPIRPPDGWQDHDPYFRERPILQRYWAMISRIHLAAEGRPTDRESVRRFQKREFATANGNTTVIELMPLPVPSIAQWPWGASNIPLLADRRRYEHDVLPRRISDLRRRIATHEPCFVVFVGTTQREWFERVAGRALPVDPPRPVPLDGGRTLAMLVRHPNSRGVTVEHFTLAGEALRAAAPRA